jgi:hypothetical protein
MESFLIATTSQQGLRPVGPAGGRSYARLVQVIEQRLSAAHMALLAEPVPSPDGSSVDWYAAYAGAAVAIQDLAGEAREKAEAELERLRGEILTLAGTLEQSGNPGEAENAAALRQAMEVPDLSYVRVVDGHPVLLAWSYTKDAEGEKSTVLQSLVDARSLARRRARRPDGPGAAAAGAAAEPALATVPVLLLARPFSWLALLLWLLLALLLLAILYVLLSGCSLGAPGRSWLPEHGWLNRCPITVASAADDTADKANEQRGKYLEDVMRQLERDLAQREAQCRVQRRAERSVPERGPSEADTPQDKEFAKRLQEQNAKPGDYQVSLMWEGTADLDLMVACPDGSRVYWDARQTCGGAVLDVDMNREKVSPRPVENVTWLAATPAPGRYRVYVKMYEQKGDKRNEIPFLVRVKKNEHVQTHPGAIQERNQYRLVTEFDVP